MAQFTVEFWGSKPMTNDDCYYGSDFDSIDEALIDFEAPVDDTSVEFVVIDGPGIHRERRNPDFVQGHDADDARREFAREEGMLNGIDSYNDWMDY